jgi:hypothetical protein
MFHKFTPTDSPEPWGQGIHSPEKVLLLDGGCFVLKGGVELADIENPTIAIEALVGEELDALKARYEIPEDWAPPEYEPGKP